MSAKKVLNKDSLMEINELFKQKRNDEALQKLRVFRESLEKFEKGIKLKPKSKWKKH